jgi:NADH dehydrogenase FAD-containing subunit
VQWKALFQGSSRELTGFMAWVLWRGAYLTKSMSWKNKLLIPVYVSLPLLLLIC